MKKRILILDDNAVDCMLIRTYLHRKKLEIEIHIAETFSIAEEKIMNESWHVIILDGELEEEIVRYGFDLIPLIRKHQKDCKIIMVSSEKKHLQTGKKMGADVIISKPIPIQRSGFQKLVKSILMGKQVGHRPTCFSLNYDLHFKKQSLYCYYKRPSGSPGHSTCLSKQPGKQGFL